MKDVLSKVTTALPAAAANSNTSSIDLGPNGGNNVDSNLRLLLELPALASLVDAKTVTLSVYDSADNSSFAAVEGYGNLVVTGAGGAGAAAKTWRLKLHDHVRQYIRINIAVLTGGGDNTASSLTTSIIYP